MREVGSYIVRTCPGLAEVERVVGKPKEGRGVNRPLVPTHKAFLASSMDFRGSTP